MHSKDNTKKPRFHYTQGAWEGENYTPGMTAKDISKAIRKELKEKFPQCKFSITTGGGTFTSSINIALMTAPFEPFVSPENLKPDIHHYANLTPVENEEVLRERQAGMIKNGHSQINAFYIAQDERITKEAKEVLTFTKKLADSFNFDDSDAMIDYFHTNFYLHLAVGKWDKPFTKVTN